MGPHNFRVFFYDYFQQLKSPLWWEIAALFVQLQSAE